MDNYRFITKLALVGALLAFVVVGLGAYTRLTDSGLGCPDWPGCYGQLTVPSSDHALAQAAGQFPGQKVEVTKAWNEMIHRYVAGSLGLLMVVLSVLLLRQAYLRHNFSVTAIFLLSLLGVQATLGMWTVTWQLLPLIVMGHLLGGLLILSSLWFVWLRHRARQPQDNAILCQRLRPWALLGLILLFAQIALGGWTSSNYAALACPDFPLCNGAWLPTTNLQDAFNLLAPIGRNYEGGHLDSLGRVTIQFVHRLGAVAVSLYLLGLAVSLLRQSSSVALRQLSLALLGLLLLQISLGIANAIHLPLFAAVGHNLVAALLLLVMLTVNYRLFAREHQQRIVHG